MQNRKRVISACILLCFYFESAACLASDSQKEIDKDGQLTDSSRQLHKSTSPKILYGQVNQLDVHAALSQYAPFGFLCAREGPNELPAKVTDVTLNSMAYWQGLKVNDRIVQLNANKNIVELSIERAGRLYSIALPNQHPLSAESSANLVSGLHQEIGKADKSVPAKILYGQVKQLDVRASLSQYAPFGFLCAREGINELPAKVTDVTLNGMAYWQGLKVNDRIIQLNANKNILELSVERAGKAYSIALSAQHPFTALEIAHNSFEGIEQKNYADCWFDASLVALAITPRGQNLIANMITEVSPTFYFVTFPGEPTISWPVSLNTMQHYQVTDKTLWARLIEQASLLRFSSEHRTGGNTAEALEILTGKRAGMAVNIQSPSSDDKPLSRTEQLNMLGNKPLKSIAEIAEILDKALLNKEAVVIDTASQSQIRVKDQLNAFLEAGVPINSNPSAEAFELIQTKLKRTPIILWTRHAYTVIDFDRNTNLITLRNPFGTDTPQQTARWAAKIDTKARNQLVQDLGNGFIRMRLDVLYPYIRAVFWSTM